MGMLLKEVELVEVRCPRCDGIHIAKKKDCREAKHYPGQYVCEVWCEGNPCDGHNGKIWHLIHGPDTWVTGVAIPESYKHPTKRLVPTFIN